MTKVTVSQMETPKHDGDWHDKPLRWKVDGPNGELQHFTTKSAADLYARFRRKSASQQEASRKFALS